jgi:hypothetical protein
MQRSLGNSDDFLSGYMDNWLKSDSSSMSFEYIRGNKAGAETKRILDGQGICANNGRYPELVGIGR